MANYTVALPAANISPLILPESARGDYTVRYQIPYSVIQGATSALSSGDTVTVTLGTTPTNWIATGLLVDIPTAFAGSSGNSSVSMTIGTTTTATAFASSFSLLSAGVYQPPNGPQSVATPSASTGTSAVTMQAVITSTCGSVTSFTTGFMTILLGLMDPTQTA